jgi:hypothetical protein
MIPADLARFGSEAAWLAGVVLRIWFLLGVSGLAVVQRFLPRFCQMRWIVFAPAAGLALITLVSLPLSLGGIPAGKYAWPLLIALALISSGSLFVAFRRSGPRRVRRLVLAHLRQCWLWLSIGFLIVVLLSAKMLTYGGNGRADGAWGSSDFGAYWIVSDYLQHNGADAAAYERQTRYHASDLEEHFYLHARLGGMTSIAVVAQAVMPGRLPAIINPLIVTMLWLLVALVQVFARRERLWPATALLAAACHPFLYFLLFYSYLGQAFSVLLIAAGLLVVEVSDRNSPTGEWNRGAIGGGLLFAAAIVQYASAFIVPGIFLAGFLLFRFRRAGLTSVLICAGTVLAVSGYHLSRSWRELSTIRALKVMPGWDWQRLVNVNELLGLRSLIKYEPLPAGDYVGIAVTTAITVLVGVALLIHLRRGALPRSAAAMLISTVALAAYACVKYWQHVHNATHGLAKVISQFALFILMFAAAGAIAAFPAQRRRAQSWALVVMAGLAVIQFMQVANWRRPPWFDYDLITLVERRAHDAVPVVFDTNLDDRLVAPLIKDYRRLAAADQAGPRLRFTLAAEKAKFPHATLVDQEGAYVALLEK